MSLREKERQDDQLFKEMYENSKWNGCIVCGADKPWRDNKDFCLNCIKYLVRYIKSQKLKDEQMINAHTSPNFPKIKMDVSKTDISIDMNEE